VIAATCVASVQLSSTFPHQITAPCILHPYLASRFFLGETEKRLSGATIFISSIWTSNSSAGFSLLLPRRHGVCSVPWCDICSCSETLSIRGWMIYSGPQTDYLSRLDNLAYINTCSNESSVLLQLSRTCLLHGIPNQAISCFPIPLTTLLAHVCLCLINRLPTIPSLGHAHRTAVTSSSPFSTQQTTHCSHAIVLVRRNSKLKKTIFFL